MYSERETRVRTANGQINLYREKNIRRMRIYTTGNVNLQIKKDMYMQAAQQQIHRESRLSMLFPSLFMFRIGFLWNFA